MSVDTAADVVVVTPEPIVPDDAPTVPKLGEAGAAFAELLAFEALAGDYVKKQRALLTDRYLEQYREHGSKTFEVKDAGGQVMVAFTLKANPAGEPSIVVGNKDAFLDWVIENHPTEVEMCPVVRPAFESALLGRIQYVPADDDDAEQFIDPETGLAVEGLKHVPGAAESDPKSFGTSWKKGGKEAAVSALLDRAVGEVLPLALSAGDDA